MIEYRKKQEKISNIQKAFLNFQEIIFENKKKIAKSHEHKNDIKKIRDKNFHQFMLKDRENHK